MKENILQTCYHRYCWLNCGGTFTEIKVHISITTSVSRPTWLCDHQGRPCAVNRGRLSVWTLICDHVYVAVIVLTQTLNESTQI